MLYVMQGDALVPVSYQARGASVRFTTPLLTSALIRMEQDNRLTILIPGLAETRAIYVLPANALTNVVSTSLFDRELIERLTALRDHAPEAIRAIELQVMAGGVAGVEMIDAAKRIADMDRAARSLFWHDLVRAALGSAEGGSTGDGGSFEPALAFRLASELERRMVSRGFDPQLIEQLLDQLADRAAPILGRSGGPESRGAVVRVLDRLRRLEAELEVWLENESTSARGVAEAVREETLSALDRCEAIIRQADAALARLVADLSPDRKVTDPFFTLLRQAWWTQDGWDRVVDCWDAAAEGTRHAQREALENMVIMLPAVPLSDLSGPEVERIKAGRTARILALIGVGRRTKADEIDAKTLLKLEQYKYTLAF